MPRCCSYCLLIFALLSVPLPQAWANFGDEYYRFYETNLDGDEALELGELQAAMRHYQDAMNQLETIMRRYPGQNQDIIMDRRSETRAKIHDLRRRGVKPERELDVPPPPNQPGQRQVLPQEWQQRLDRQAQQLRQERTRVADLERRLRQQQQASNEKLQDEQTRSARLQAEVIRLREAATQERRQGELNASQLQARILELEGELAQSTQLLVEANLRNEELRASLDTANLRIAELESAQEKWLVEKEQLEERMRLAATKEGIELLVQDNRRLLADFEKLQENYDKLKEQNELDNQQAFALKLQVSELQQQIEISSIENKELSERLERTELALTTKTEQLEEATSEVDIQTAESEIRILRAELARQKGLHEHNQLMRKTLIERLSQIGEDGEEIRQLLDGMIVQELDADERQQQRIDRLLAQAAGGVIVQPDQGQERRAGANLILASEEMEAIQSLSQTAKEDIASGNFERALESYDRILQSVPNDVPTLVERGVLLLRTGRSTDAEASLKKALAQRQEDSHARTMLALALLDQERTERAIEELELAIEFNPIDATAHFYRGLIAHRESDFATAEAQYVEAITLNAELADAHFNLALLLCDMSPVNGKRIHHHYMMALEHKAPRNRRIEDIIDEYRSL